MTASTHDLLLALAGRVDDDLLAWARELVAVGEDTHAVELLAAALVADHTRLPDPVRDALVAAARGARPDLDIDAALAPAGPDEIEHGFDSTAGQVERIADVLRGLPPRRLAGCRVYVTWRVTPAGSAPGPVPHPVVLAEVDPDRSTEALAYQLAVELDRAGVPASVEVFARGADLPTYHRAALRDTVEVNLAAPGRPDARSGEFGGEHASRGGLPDEPVPDRPRSRSEDTAPTVMRHRRSAAGRSSGGAHRGTRRAAPPLRAAAFVEPVHPASATAPADPAGGSLFEPESWQGFTDPDAGSAVPGSTESPEHPQANGTAHPDPADAAAPADPPRPEHDLLGHVSPLTLTSGPLPARVPPHRRTVSTPPDGVPTPPTPLPFGAPDAEGGRHTSPAASDAEPESPRRRRRPSPRPAAVTPISHTLPSPIPLTRRAGGQAVVRELRPVDEPAEPDVGAPVPATAPPGHGRDEMDNPLSGPPRTPLLDPVFEPSETETGPYEVGQAPRAPVTEEPQRDAVEPWSTEPAAGNLAIPYSTGPGGPDVPPVGPPFPAPAWHAQPHPDPGPELSSGVPPESDPPEPAQNAARPVKSAPNTAGEAVIDVAVPEPVAREQDTDPGPTHPPEQAEGPDPDALAQLSNTERELLARLHEELAAREGRPRPGHRAGTNGQHPANPESNGRSNGPPPDIAG